MKVYRLSRKKYTETLSGKGAALSANRWNSKGVEMIYTAESRALAMAEVIVHLSLDLLPKDFVLLEITIPDSISLKTIHTKTLPENWSRFPYEHTTQMIGDNFIKENEYAVLKVPSAVVRGDFNFLINPFHPEFETIKITSKQPFLFDRRLLKW